MTSTLSHSDVTRLLADPSPHVRADVAAKLAGELDNPALNEKELQLAQDIVRVMAKDVAVTVRECLAISLRRANKLPHDVAVQLAKDIEQVALPILTDSPVLTEADLVAVVKEGAETKQQAVAKRANVPETVSAAIVEAGSETAVADLMKNQTAQVSEAILTQALERFPQSTTVHEPIVKRDKLPVAVAERMVVLVTEKLKDYLVTHHELSPNTATDLLLQSRERATINLLSNSDEADTERMVVQLYRNKRLTPSLVIRALCTGDVGFFEAALAVMANIPLVNARILIHDAGRLGLKSVYDKSGLPPRLLSAVRVALDVVHETEFDGEAHDIERYRRRVLERILTQFEDMHPEDLEYLLDKLDVDQAA